MFMEFRTIVTDPALEERFVVETVGTFDDHIMAIGGCERAIDRKRAEQYINEDPVTEYESIEVQSLNQNVFT